MVQEKYVAAKKREFLESKKNKNSSWGKLMLIQIAHTFAILLAYLMCINTRS